MTERDWSRRFALQLDVGQGNTGSTDYSVSGSMILSWRSTMSFRRILIAVDNQPMSLRAAELGTELGRAVSGEIALINVSNAVAEFDRAEMQSKTFLSCLRDRLALPFTTQSFVQTGMPGPTIVKKAKEWSADVVVIASHGRTGVPRALFGSVAEEVMRHAPCPVLVVRANVSEQLQASAGGPRKRTSAE